MSLDRSRSLPRTTRLFDWFSKRYNRSWESKRGQSLSDDRRNLLVRAEGDVLEVGVGTGLNFEYYPDMCRVTGIDVSPKMIEQAQGAASKVAIEASASVGLAGDQPADAFDTVVTTWVLCWAKDPAGLVRDCARTLRDGGRFLALEPSIRPFTMGGAVWLLTWPFTQLLARSGAVYDLAAIAAEAGLEVTHSERIGPYVALEAVKVPMAPLTK